MHEIFATELQLLINQAINGVKLSAFIIKELAIQIYKDLVIYILIKVRCLLYLYFH
jgi:hypothetical protein